MINKYFDGIIPNYKGIVNQVDKDLEESVKVSVSNNKEFIDKFEFSNAIQSIWNLVSRTNKYIDEVEPWVLSKDNKIEELSSAMNHLASSLKVIAILIRPFMLETSNKILKQLGLNNNVSFEDLNNIYSFDNNKVIEKGEPIFLRLDTETEIEYIKELMNNH